MKNSNIASKYLLTKTNGKKWLKEKEINLNKEVILSLLDITQGKLG